MITMKITKCAKNELRNLTRKIVKDKKFIAHNQNKSKKSFGIMSPLQTPQGSVFLVSTKRTALRLLILKYLLTC